MAPRGSASSVFTEFESNGWPATGLACLVGLNGPLPYLTGADSSVHLAEELKDSAWRLPRSMLVVAISNYITAFIIVVTLMFCLGDIDAAIKSSTGQPYIEVILNATHSVAAAKILATVILIMVLSCSVNGVTTTSRQLWSFARDGGLPFSPWLSKVHPKLDVPVNAMAVSMVFTICLTAIAIGSEVAYGIFVSLNASGLLTSYIICITCVLSRRLSGASLPPSRFNLGKAGNAVNIIALCFLSVFFVFQFFPAAPGPAPAEMNWSCVIWISVLIFFMTYYAFIGRHNYVGPVASMSGFARLGLSEMTVDTETAMNLLSEDAAWLLLQVVGVAAVVFILVQKMIAQYPSLSSRLKSSSWKHTISAEQKELSTPSKCLDIKANKPPQDSLDWASMGEITPLPDLNYQRVEPLRVYKFSLRKTDVDHIIQIDKLYPSRIQARKDIIQQYPGALACLDSGVSMLNELYEFLVQCYLPQRYPTMFKLSAAQDTLQNLVTDEVVLCDAPADRFETLRILNRTVDEDFLLLAPSTDGSCYSLQSFVWAVSEYLNPFRTK
ncbi:uncharacterized protein KY384_008970 [Bacidia gigantensis]|uniref:uncharacterized protein n=1 Tax=Bacidia gigantensis TaxID=2732470 RepID=UPI001D047E19|nr:uncharacterized protein KY384_008970 [Bacidia gigantensis]KAG8525326.1 hypothetical protein KY384_008970 [Bacidia gigantensis]